MNLFQKPRVVGAFVIGFALIALSYTLSNFGQPRYSSNPDPVVEVTEAPLRVFVPVTDTNEDGVEDWQEQFVSAPPIKLASGEEPYELPTTVTDKLGISLMQGLMAAQVAGPVVRSKEEIIADNVDDLSKVATSDKIYDVSALTISSDNSDLAIKEYGNAVATILIKNRVKPLRHELAIMEDYVTDLDQNSLSELKLLATAYANFRDQTIALPVPNIFIKEHLDLINVYHATAVTALALTQIESDPMLAFLRLQRYENDLEGLVLALNNMYNGLLPYSHLFGPNDPVMLITTYSNNYQ